MPANWFEIKVIYLLLLILFDRKYYFPLNSISSVRWIFYYRYFFLPFLFFLMDLTIDASNELNIFTMYVFQNYWLFLIEVFYSNHFIYLVLFIVKEKTVRYWEPFCRICLGFFVNVFIESSNVFLLLRLMYP